MGTEQLVYTADPVASRESENREYQARTKKQERKMKIFREDAAAPKLVCSDDCLHATYQALPKVLVT